MFRPRVIPVLLLKNQILYKSKKFKNYKYIGDPINAVKLYNDFKADEIIFLDILASKQGSSINIDFISKVSEEANMPFSVGGGISSISEIKKIIQAGAEKVIINNSAIENPGFIKNAIETFGSSTIVVCIDVKKKLFGGYGIWSHKKGSFIKIPLLDYIRQMEHFEIGELVIQSVDNDGLMSGYDLNLLKLVPKDLKIPLIALGGAGTILHMKQAYDECNINGLAAGSMFVYQGPHNGVLINYPSKSDLIF